MDIDSKTAPYAGLVLRVTLGIMFIAHGAYLKVFVFTLPGTAQFFVSLGLPEFTAYLTTLAETVIGVALVLGVYARYAAAASIPILLGASWVHIGNGWLFSAQGGGWEYPVFLTVAAAVQVLLGDGAHALRTSPAPTLATR